MKIKIILLIIILSITACNTSTPVYNPVDIEETAEITTLPPVIVTTSPVITSPPVTTVSLTERIDEALKDPAVFTYIMETIAEKYKVTGMSAAVFAEGKIIYTFNYGYANQAGEIPVTDDTKYRSASVSKIITAICAMLLVDRGRLDLDTPISDIIGLNMDGTSETPNTARHLLTHTSSIADGIAYSRAFRQNPPLTLEQMLILGIWSGGIPGDRFDYSNFGMGLIAAVIESVTDTRFYTFAYENLFAELNMDAAYIREHLANPANVANIYRGGVSELCARTWGRTEFYYNQMPLGWSYGLGEGELIISATDLAKFGIILSGDGTFNNIRVLSKEAVNEMNTVFIYDEADWGHGLGLRISGKIVEGRILSGHPGQALGMVSGLFFDPSDTTGVAILTNGCAVNFDENGMYGINNAVVRAVYEFFFD
jgi:CubicO group peptidase (beta-lactamase class C family)